MTTIEALPNEILDLIFNESRLVTAIMFSCVSKYWRERMRIYRKITAAEGLNILVEQNEVRLLSLLFNIPLINIMAIIGVLSNVPIIPHNNRVVIPTNYPKATAFVRCATLVKNIVTPIRWATKYCHREFEISAVDAILTNNIEIVNLTMTQNPSQLRIAPIVLASCLIDSNDIEFFSNFNEMMYLIIEQLGDRSIKQVDKSLFNGEFELLQYLPEKAFADLYDKYKTNLAELMMRLPYNSYHNLHWFFAKMSRYDLDGLRMFIMAIVEEQIGIIDILCTVYGIRHFTNEIIDLIKSADNAKLLDWSLIHILTACRLSENPDSPLFPAHEEIIKIYRAVCA